MIQIILINILLYLVLRVQLVRKFKSSYTIYLKDGKGNRQTLSDTVAYLLEKEEIHEKQIKYLAQEIENQWLMIEKVKMVTGADKYIQEIPSPMEKS